MRICYIANASSIHTLRWVQYFVEKGHQISLISLESPRFDYGGVRVKMLKKVRQSAGPLSHSLNFLPVLFQLKNTVKKEQFDIVHALSSSYGWLAALSGCHPLIMTIADPGVLPDLPKPFYYNLFNRYAFKKADLITTQGENTRKAMIKLEANPSIIHIIQLGVDTTKFRAGKNKKLKQKIFEKENKIIISTKPLRWECDVETLIRAVPEILKEVPEAKFIIAGDGDQKEYLINLAKILNVSGAVKFLGNISSDELPQYLNSTDIYICTSLVDSGLAVSTAEAMACELPIVVSDSGDNKILIKDGENGFLFPIRDSKTLAKKVIYLLKNEDLRKKIAKKNKKFIEEKNNYYKEMEKMEKIYKELANYKK